LYVIIDGCVAKAHGWDEDAQGRLPFLSGDASEFGVSNANEV
jgi:hypothetical protein